MTYTLCQHWTLRRHVKLYTHSLIAQCLSHSCDWPTGTKHRLLTTPLPTTGGEWFREQSRVPVRLAIETLLISQHQWVSFSQDGPPAAASYANITAKQIAEAAEVSTCWLRSFVSDWDLRLAQPHKQIAHTDQLHSDLARHGIKERTSKLVLDPKTSMSQFSSWSS